MYTIIHMYPQLDWSHMCVLHWTKPMLEFSQQCNNNHLH